MFIDTFAIYNDNGEAVDAFDTNDELEARRLYLDKNKLDEMPAGFFSESIYA